MSDLIISEPLASRIREVARQDNLAPEELIAISVERYALSPRPVASLTGDDIELPSDIADDEKEAYRAVERVLRPKLYRIARRYWAKIGDKERLALTDEELDKQFWLIDHNGIPRFKSEKGTVELPPDPLEPLIGLFADSDVTDASITVRETMAKKYDRPD